MRRAAGYILVALLLSVLSFALSASTLSLSTDILTFLLVVVVASLIGGLGPALLDLSRLRAGGLPLVLEATSVAEIAASALDELGASGVAVEVPDDLPDVSADAALLHRVVVNLVSNALRYGGPSPAVEASARGHRVLIRVVDHGPGIPAERFASMFTPFQSSRSGVGLGLALSQGLVEAMSGTLTPSTTPGGGLTMTIALSKVSS